MRSWLAPLTLAITLALAGCGSADPTGSTPAVTDANETGAGDTAESQGEASDDGGAEDGNEPETNDGNGNGNTDDDGDSEELFPDVVDAVATDEGGGSWTFAVTLSSPYDSPDRYADSWRVRSEDGTVFGERFLTHDHAGEQPFTRSQSGIEIPDDVDVVVVEGRDQVSGWGGDTLTVQLDRT